MKKRILLAVIAGLLVAICLWLPLRRAAAAREELDVVVNNSNSVSTLSVEDARKIFMGDKTVWPGGKHITVLMLASGQAERAVVLRELYQMTEADYAKYFLQAAFTGKVQEPPRDLSSVVQMKQAVSANPKAIGYLMKDDVGDSVKVVLKLP